MAQRLISKTLKNLRPSIPYRTVPHRHYSSHHHKVGPIIEIDLDSSSSSSSPSVEVVELKNLNEFVQNVMVYRFAPDWLPFLPGSSFWVPPVPPNFANNLLRLQSFASQGDFGSASGLPFPEEVEVVHLESSTEKPSSEDDE